MGAMHEQIRNTKDPEVAKAMAALCALKFSKDMGFNKIILEGDAMGIINKLKRDSFDLSKVGNLIEIARKESKNFGVCNLSHVKREANKVAHCLSLLAYFYTEPNFGLNHASIMLE